MNFGNFAVALALASGLAALQAYFFYARGRTDLRSYARGLTVGLAVGIIAASAFQMSNILTHQFEYEYVTNFSDRALPTLLLFSTFWRDKLVAFCFGRCGACFSGCS